jgi:hypothetical protein
VLTSAASPTTLEIECRKPIYYSGTFNATDKPEVQDIFYSPQMPISSCHPYLSLRCPREVLTTLCCSTFAYAVHRMQKPTTLARQTRLLSLRPPMTSYKNMHAPVTMSSLPTLPASCPRTLSHKESATTTSTTVLTTSILPATYPMKHLHSPPLLSPRAVCLISTHVRLHAHFPCLIKVAR